MNSSDTWVERILRVVDHVQGHLDDDLSPEELAEVAGFSRHHFHRVFRGMVGESVMGFVRRLRLERAAMRLKFGRSPVTRVAFDAGYGSHEAFTRAFRARFGMAPTEFRDERAPDAPVPYEMTVREEPDRHGIAYRYTGPYSACAEAWIALMSWAGPLGLAAQSSASLGLCYDDPDVTDASRLRYDACLVLPEATVSTLTGLPPHLAKRRVSGGRYGIALHCGPYETNDDAYYALLGRWLPHRGVELSDEPIVERYINNPGTVAPEELLTEICVRLT